MKNQIDSETETLRTNLIILKIYHEAKTIPEELLIRIINLFRADDLNIETDIDEILIRRKFLIDFIQIEYKIFIKDEVYNFKNYHPKSVKKNKLNQVKFGQQTLKLLHLVSFEYGINPYKYFEGLIKERFIFIDKQVVYIPERFQTISEFKRKLQNENSELFFPNYINIYNANREPYSKDFMDICREKLDKDNDTFTSEYNELRKLRMSLVSYLVNAKCVSTHNGTVCKEERGRKKTIK